MNRRLASSLFALAAFGMAGAAAPAFAPPPGAPMSFADIFEKVSPAVVSIDVTSRVGAGSLRPPNFPFGPNGKPGEEDNPGQDEGNGRPRQQSSGSGFLISADGYIVTNNHVVAPGRQGAVVETITVTLPDRREFKARLVGRDLPSDLAVLKIDAGSNLPFVRFGDSTHARVGDWVLAIGIALVVIAVLAVTVVK